MQEKVINNSQNFQPFQEPTTSFVSDISMSQVLREAPISVIQNSQQPSYPEMKLATTEISYYHPPPQHNVTTFSNNDQSELANILKGGQYILEKRPSQTSIQKSVIVEATSLQTVSQEIEGAITSQKLPLKRKNLKRKSEPVSVKEEYLQKSESSNANFQKLQKLVPSLSDTSVKVSKAAQLMKAAEQIKILKKGNDNLNNEIEMLKATSAELLQNITSSQNELSFNGKGRL